MVNLVCDFGCFVKIIILIFVLMLRSPNNVIGDCTISIKEDLKDPQAIFLEKQSFLSPSQDGVVVIRSGSVIKASCPGNNNFVVLGNDSTIVQSVILKCISKQTFQFGKWTGDIKEVRCKVSPWFTTETTNKTCYGGNHIIRVGYNTTSKMHDLYDVCFDPNLMKTYYVKHILSPKIAFRQIAGKSSRFVATTLFGKVRMNDLYKLKNQLTKVNALLGGEMAEKYLNLNQFLNRGHLAPRADFTLRSEQRASFHYINTAPQWRKFNAGDWAALEQALRDKVIEYGISVVLYTGTYGVTTLTDSQGVKQEIYLSSDDNNNNIVPVPLYFYKIVYEPIKRRATVFISINNPYYTEKENEDLIFCQDVCAGNHQFKWIRWRHDDFTTSFCCEYHEFVNIIKSAPLLDVKDLFY